MDAASLSHLVLDLFSFSSKSQGVYILSSEVSSLACTLVVTLRKFFSLLFSIYYFKNPFSVYHWVGTSLVFGGTIVFLDLISIIRNTYFSSDSSSVDGKKDANSIDDHQKAPDSQSTHVSDYTSIKKRE